MATFVPPKINTALEFYVGLPSQANLNILQVNPTLAAGDVKVSIGGGAFNNLGTLPVVTPAGGKSVKVTLSTSEANDGNSVVVFSDAAGDEWCDVLINVQTVAQQNDDLLGTVVALVESTGVPAASASGASKLTRLYDALISGLTVTTATGKLQFKNAAGTVLWEKDLTDAAGVYTESAGNAP
jgi:hypothetical protein